MIGSFSRSSALVSLMIAAGLVGCASTGGDKAAPAAAPAPTAAAKPAAAPAPAPAPAAAAAAAPANLPVYPVFTGEGAVQPYTLFLGTPANFSTTVPKNGLGSLDAGSIKVEPTKIGDATGAKFTWTGGLGQFHLQSKTANDLLDYIDANSAMVFDAVIHKNPEDQVTMRVDCRYPCLGVVDMTNFYKAAPLEKKIQVKMPLSCFEATGTRFTAVNTPLVIFTTKPFSLSVANVRYVPGAAKDADALKCTP
jgi:beta-glucosidase